jgi:hypothetical protein
MATVQEEIEAYKKALQVLKEFESPVKSPPQPGPGVGIPSLEFQQSKFGEAGGPLTPGNESGILSIGGRPGEQLPEPYPTFDLQTAISDQARAAEDAEAAGAPSPQQVFLESLHPEQESLGGRLQRAGNLASGAFTLGSKAGLTFPPIAAGLAAANAVGNVYNQAWQDRQFIPNANPLATILRAMTPQGFHRFIPGLTPGLERTVGKIPPGLGFHPTPEQSRVLSSDPVSLPSKRQPVTTETLGPPSNRIPTTDPDLFGIAQQLGRADPRFAVNVASDITGDVDDAPSYDPTSASFVDWDE